MPEPRTEHNATEEIRRFRRDVVPRIDWLLGWFVLLFIIVVLLLLTEPLRATGDELDAVVAFGILIVGGAIMGWQLRKRMPQYKWKNGKLR